MTKHTPEKELTIPSHDEFEGYPEKRKAYFEEHLGDNKAFGDIDDGPVPRIGDRPVSVGKTALNTLAPPDREPGKNASPETNIPLSRDE